MPGPLQQALYFPAIAGKCGGTAVVAVEKFQRVLQIYICVGNGLVKVRGRGKLFPPERIADIVEIIDDWGGWRARGIHKLTNKQPEQPYYSHKSDCKNSSDIHRYRIFEAVLLI